MLNVKVTYKEYIKCCADKVSVDRLALSIGLRALVLINVAVSAAVCAETDVSRALEPQEVRSTFMREFDLPESFYINPTTKNRILKIKETRESFYKGLASSCNDQVSQAGVGVTSSVRECQAKYVYSTRWYNQFNEFDVKIDPKTIQNG